VRTLELGPLPEAAAAVMLDLVEDAIHLPLHEQRTLLDRAQGNPLFLRVLVRARIEGGAGVELPDTLDALLSAQIDRLLPPDRRLLRAAGVLGVRFDLPTLQQLLDDQPIDPAAWTRLESFVAADSADRMRFT